MTHGRCKPSLTISDTLLDLHAKLATVVRYYDRMLEDRLSNTYSQHNLGGYRSHAPPSSSMYPSIPTEPLSGQGGAESYYNMNGPPQVEAYPTPQSQYNNYPPPQSQYTQRDRAPSNTSSGYERSQHNAQIPQRASSLQSYPRPPSQIQDGPYTTSNQPQGYPQYQQPSMEPPPQTPAMHNPQDPATAYYSNQPQISPPQAYQQQRVDSNYGSAPSPEQTHQALAQQQPTHPGLNPQQNAPPPQSQQAYWQQSQAAPAPQQQNYVAPYQPINSYTQDSFPTAPSHQPQPKQQEEQLIEL